MAEDPFGRGQDDQDPFGNPSTGGPAGWAPPTPPAPGATPPVPVSPQPGWTPPAPGGGATGPVGGGGQQPTNGKATAALVLGILGLPFFCPVLCSVPALVLGYQARKEIDASGGVQQGRGQAKAGIVMGWIGTVVGAIGIVLIIVLAATGNLDDEDAAGDALVQLSSLLRR